MDSGARGPRPAPLQRKGILAGQLREAEHYAQVLGTPRASALRLFTVSGTRCPRRVCFFSWRRCWCTCRWRARGAASQGTRDTQRVRTAALRASICELLSCMEEGERG